MALRRSEELMWLWQRMIAQGWMVNGDGLSFPEALAQACQTADAAALRESLGDCYSFFDGRSLQRFLQVVEQLLEHGQVWEPDPEAS
jgi:hypothetical protein